MTQDAFNAGELGLLSSTKWTRTRGFLFTRESTRSRVPCATRNRRSPSAHARHCDRHDGRHANRELSASSVRLRVRPLDQQVAVPSGTEVVAFEVDPVNWARKKRRIGTRPHGCRRSPSSVINVATSHSVCSAPRGGRAIPGCDRLRPQPRASRHPDGRPYGPP